MLSTLSPLSFLITPTFWSRIGFLISYIATSFLVLEILRLIYTDANKREVEKFLEAYSKERSISPRGRKVQDAKSMISVSIEELERPAKVVRRRSKDSEKTLVDREERRRKRAVSQTQVQAQALHQHPSKDKEATASPTRRLRKRSDTLTSTGSAEKRPLRRHREASPASEAGSKVSSRHGSPRPKSRDGKGLGLGGLGLGMGRVREKV